MSKPNKNDVIKQAIDALTLSNTNWKSFADSGDSGFWQAEKQDYYIQSEQAIEALENLATELEAATQQTDNVGELSSISIDSCTDDQLIQLLVLRQLEVLTSAAMEYIEHTTLSGIKDPDQRIQFIESLTLLVSKKRMVDKCTLLMYKCILSDQQINTAIRSCVDLLINGVGSKTRKDIKRIVKLATAKE